MIDTRKVRACSHLLEPPAPEVVGELCDEIDRLHKIEEAARKVVESEWPHEVMRELEEALK